MRYLSLLLSLVISTIFFGQVVEVSHSSGKYDGSISVEIAGDFTKAYFSIDGSKPSRRFSKSIEISKSTFLQIIPVFAGDSIDDFALLICANEHPILTNQGFLSLHIQRVW